MRSIVLVLAALLMPLAQAAPATTVSPDAAGDVQWSFGGAPFANDPVCAAPAIDMTSVEITVAGGVVTVTLHVADASTGPHCVVGLTELLRNYVVAVKAATSPYIGTIVLTHAGSHWFVMHQVSTSAGIIGIDAVEVQAPHGDPSVAMAIRGNIQTLQGGTVAYDLSGDHANVGAGAQSFGKDAGIAWVAIDNAVASGPDLRA